MAIKLSKLMSSDFSRGATLLIAGNALAQAITIILSPILTRLYTPSDFGLWALFVTICTLLSVLLTGQYQSAIMLPKKHENAYHITVLSLVLALVSSCVVLLLLFVFAPSLSSLMGDKSLGILLYFVPFSACSIAVIGVLSTWLSRERKYRELAVNPLMQNVCMGSISVASGNYALGASGLIGGQVSGQALAMGRLLYIFFKKREYRFSLYKIFALAKRHRKFPQITMAHSLFSALSKQMPIVMITAFFSPTLAGFYFLAHRVASVPVTLVSQSLYRVFFATFIHAPSQKRFFSKKFIQVNLVFAPLFIVIGLIAPYIFPFIFGDEWKEAGSYVQIILPLLYAKFISNMFTTTAYLFHERQAENFLFEIIITVCAALSLYFGFVLSDIKLGLRLMVFSNIVIILFKVWRSFLFLNKADIKNA